MTLRQFESLADLEHHQSLATPIKDALRIVRLGILEEHEQELKLNPDLLAKCQQVAEIMEDARKKIESIMLRTEARRGGNAVQIQQSGSNAVGLIPSGHVTKGGDFIPEDDEMNPTDDPIGGGISGVSGSGMGSGSINSILMKNKSASNSKNNSPLRVDSVLMQGGSGAEDNVLLMDDEKLEQHEANAKPFSHVVIDSQVEKVEEQNDLEMPLEIEWVLDQMVDSLGDSIVVTSNLRRAISTAVISLWDRY